MLRRKVYRQKGRPLCHPPLTKNDASAQSTRIREKDFMRNVRALGLNDFITGVKAIFIATQTLIVRNDKMAADCLSDFVCDASNL
jgi:hypothetical protein